MRSPEVRARSLRAVFFLFSLAVACAAPAVPTTPSPIASAEIPPAPLTASASAAPLASSAPAPPTSASTAVAAKAPRVKKPHTGPLPNVAAALVPLRDALKDLGQLALRENGKSKELVCTGCLPAQPDRAYTFLYPAVAGSFTAAGKQELLVQAGGDCGVQGRSWGCLVIVGDGPNGRDVIRTHGGFYNSDQLHAHRIEGDRDLAVGVFGGSQMAAAWTEAFAVDFAPEEPDPTDILVAVEADACGDTAISEANSVGKVDKAISKDVDGDGLLDLVVTGSYGERIVLDPFRGCKPSPTPVASRFKLTFLRGPGAFRADAASAKAGANKVSLRLFGVPSRQRPD